MVCLPPCFEPAKNITDITIYAIGKMAFKKFVRSRNDEPYF